MVVRSDPNVLWAALTTFLNCVQFDFSVVRRYRKPVVNVIVCQRLNAVAHGDHTSV